MGHGLRVGTVIVDHCRAGGLAALAPRGHRPPRRKWADRDHEAAEIRACCPATGHKNGEMWISRKNKQNTTMVVTDRRALLFYRPPKPASCAE